MKLFEPYITDKADVVWIAWVKHVQYIELMVKKELSTLEIVELDKAVFDATQAFNKVPEFKGYFKPKQHFASHASIDTLRMGPLRGYWTYSFEGFHQRVKQIAKDSNYKNVSKRILRYWSVQFGLEFWRR